MSDRCRPSHKPSFLEPRFLRNIVTIGQNFSYQNMRKYNYNIKNKLYLTYVLFRFSMIVTTTHFKCILRGQDSFEFFPEQQSYFTYIIQIFLYTMGRHRFD